MYPSIYVSLLLLSIYPSVYLSIYLSLSLSLSPSLWLSFYIDLAVSVCIYLTSHFFIYRSVYLWIHLCIYVSKFPSTHGFGRFDMTLCSATTVVGHMYGGARWICGNCQARCGESVSRCPWRTATGFGCCASHCVAKWMGQEVNSNVYHQL